MTVTLGVLSVLGLSLACSGFGVAIALASVFSLDVLEVLHSPSDYLGASTYVFGQALVNFSMTLNDEFMSYALWAISPFVAIACILAVLVFIGITHLWNSRSLKISGCKKIGISSWNWVLRHRAYWFIPAVGGGVWGLMAMAFLSIRWLGLSFMVLPALSIITSMGLAKIYFYQSVIAPTECVALKNAADRQKEYAAAQLKTYRKPTANTSPSDSIYKANCVQVEEGKGINIRKGRRVIATSEVVVLFDPITGATQVVPRKEAVVTTIGKL
jgi:hypothetical protein